MTQIKEQFWLVLALFIILPMFFMIFIPEPYGTITMVGTNLLMIAYMRKMFASNLNNLFGNKMKYQCLTCTGTKFSKDGSCFRCGSKSKRVF